MCVFCRRRVSVSVLLRMTVNVTLKTVCRICNLLWSKSKLRSLPAKTIYRVLSLSEVLPLSKKKMMADGGSHTLQERQSSQSDDLERQGEEQLVKVVQVHVRTSEGECWHQDIRWWRQVTNRALFRGRRSVTTKGSRWACLSLVMRVRCDARSPGCSLEVRARFATATARHALREWSVKAWTV